MRLALFLSLLTIFFPLLASAQAPAASPFEAPILAFFDSTGAQFGDFAQTGNAIFLRPNGKAWVVPTDTDGFLPGIPFSGGGFLHFDGVDCTGNAVVTFRDSGGSLWEAGNTNVLALYAAASSPISFIAHDPNTLRVWEIKNTITKRGEFTSVSYLNYAMPIGRAEFGDCFVTMTPIPAGDFLATNHVVEVTSFFTGFVAPFELLPLGE
jgi:hypothetical protein